MPEKQRSEPGPGLLILVTPMTHTALCGHDTAGELLPYQLSLLEGSSISSPQRLTF